MIFRVFPPKNTFRVLATKSTFQVPANDRCSFGAANTQTRCAEHPEDVLWCDPLEGAIWCANTWKMRCDVVTM